jgi:enterochelin esterase-like enzyme
VLYLLHGNYADYMSWIYFVEVNLIVDECISTRKIPPVILVMPDGGNSRYINNHDQSIRYEDFFFHEFIPEIESKFRIKSDKWFRGILGLSMGCYGALVYAIKYPDLFSVCVAFSASIYTDEMTISMADEQWNLNRGLVHGAGLQGEARLTEHYKSYDPFRLIQNAHSETLKTIRLNRCYGEMEKELGKMLSSGEFTIYHHAEPELNASDGRCQMLRSCAPNALEDGCLLPQV